MKRCINFLEWSWKNPILPHFSIASSALYAILPMTKIQSFSYAHLEFLLVHFYKSAQTCWCLFQNRQYSVVIHGCPKTRKEDFYWKLMPQHQMSSTAILYVASIRFAINKKKKNFRNRKRLAGPFHPAISLHSQLFAVSLDGRHIYAGGIWDSSLKVFNVSRGKNVASITRHSGQFLSHRVYVWF